MYVYIYIYIYMHYLYTLSSYGGSMSSPKGFHVVIQVYSFIKGLLESLVRGKFEHASACCVSSLVTGRRTSTSRHRCCLMLFDTMNYHNLPLLCKAPVNSILGFRIRTHKKQGSGRLRYTIIKNTIVQTWYSCKYTCPGIRVRYYTIIYHYDVVSYIRPYSISYYLIVYATLFY